MCSSSATRTKTGGEAISSGNSASLEANIAFSDPLFDINSLYLTA